LSEAHRPVGGAIRALIVSFIQTGVVDEAIEELDIKAGESGARLGDAGWAYVRRSVRWAQGSSG